MRADKPYDELLEKALLRRIAQGDQNAFTELFDHYQAMVYDFALKLTRSKSQAEEIVQQIFMKVWMSRSSITEIENFGAYLNRAARNQSYSALRSIAADVARAEALKVVMPFEELTTENHILFNESSSILRRVVESLPPQRKLVYELCHEEGLKYEEVAEKLNISPGTVHKHMKLALKTIREHFTTMILLLIVWSQFQR